MPVNQIHCEGVLCGGFSPAVVECIGTDQDGSGTGWSCTADLPKEVKVDVVKMMCVGESKRSVQA